MTSREAFLDRVRRAVAAGNRAGIVHPLPDRNGVGYQGAGSDPLERFETEWKAAGGQLHLLQDADAARAKALDLIQTHQARKILLGSDPLLLTLDLQSFLQRHGLEVASVQDLDVATSREPFFAADIGISGVDFLIAETGSLVMRSTPSQPRSISLLPPVHIAVADHAHLLPDLFDLFARYQGGLPSCLALITGPSKTGDIELRLVTGVHGPGEVHVVLLPAGAG